MSLSEEALVTEIHDVHQVIGDWFGGRAVDRESAFQRLAGILHPDFTLVPPNGVEVDASTFLGQIERAWAQRPEVEFYADDIRIICSAESFTVVRFKEYDREPDYLGVRVSTAILKHSNEQPAGFLWFSLQETKIRANKQENPSS